MDCKRKLSGTVTVPTSKSVLARLMILGALSDGKCVFRNVKLSGDSEIMFRALRDLGYKINLNKSTMELKILGTGGNIPKKKASIYVGNAGTAARFLTVLCGLSDGEYTINGSPEMNGRPMKGIFDCLSEIGASISFLGEKDSLPAVILGHRPERAVNIKVDVSESTQFASGLILCRSLLPEGSVIERVNEGRNSYIQLTEKVMDEFNQRMNAEGDVSSAAYIAAAVFLMGGSVTVNNISMRSDQSDACFIRLLEQNGLEVSEDENGVTFSGKGYPEGFAIDIDIDMKDFSDQVMTLAVLSALGRGKTTIRNIGHIRKQECDRISCIKENMDILGIECEEGEDYLVIHGGEPRPGKIKSRGDHRIVMAFYLMKSRISELKIDDRRAVSKSFPDFFEVMDGMGF